MTTSIPKNSFIKDKQSFWITMLESKIAFFGRMGYRLDSGSGVWVTKNKTDFAYSDGDEQEKYIFNAILTAKDVSCSSDELPQKIKDWPSEYHLSPLRINLMTPFRIKKRARVLELGCGMGAITRYLGEMGADVIAIDGSLQRAAIARERCRDLNNVQVVCNNFKEFQTDEKFDIVTLIGVMEYSPKFIGGNKPISECLAIAKNFLKPEGTVIIAIENRLGLKYWNNCAEDHTGRMFDSIHDAYAPGTVMTFGYEELKNVLITAGFMSIEFMFPFPDYKLPSVILQEESFRQKEVSFASIIGQHPSRDYSGQSNRNFSEQLAWYTIEKNGLIPHFSNSFCCFCSLSPDARPLVSKNWIAKIYSSSRSACFRTETTIYRDKTSNVIQVSKERVYPDLTMHQGPLVFNQDIENNYIQGTMLSDEILRALLRHDTLDMFFQKMNEYKDAVISISRSLNPEIRAGYCPGELLDCTPFNLVRDDNQTLHYIDNEWIMKEDLPLHFVLLRGILEEITNKIKFLDNPFIFGQFATLKDLVKAVFKAMDLRLLPEDIEYYCIHESLIQSQVSGLRDNESMAVKERNAVFLDPLNVALGIVDRIAVYEIFKMKHGELVKDSHKKKRVKKIDPLLPERLEKSKQYTTDSIDLLNLHKSAIHLFKQGRPHKAIKIMHQALLMDPGNAEYHNDLGVLYFHSGRDDKATELFLRAIDLDDTQIDARKNLADLHAASRRITEAELLYKEILVRQPDDTEALSELAAIYKTSGHLYDSSDCHDRIAETQNKLSRENPSLFTNVDTKRGNLDDDRTIQKSLTVSIIIPVFNQVEYTIQCLEALKKNTPDELYELIIVDNNSTDGTHEFLASLEGDVKIITNETNLGFAKACNQGARAASGKYLVFLNNDTISHTGWLTELVKTADEHEDIGIVGSKLLFPNGTIQHAGVVIVETPSGKLGNHIYWGFPGSFKQANIARDYQVVTAACMLIPRDLFFSADAFDERYINGMEDVDLCLKVRNLGKRVFYCPTSVLTHFESKTPGRFDKVNENERLFIKLWDNKIEADINKYLIKDGYRIEYTDEKTSWKYHEELFQKLLTVIITTQNSLTMLKRMIENVMLCTSLPIEIIVVDKNSSDGTKEYLKTLHDIHIVNMEEKSCPAECFIAGLDNAKGDYIAFLNPEVVLTTDWDTQFILKFKKNTSAVSTIIYSYEDLMNYESLMRNLSIGKIDLNYFASLIARWNQDNNDEKGHFDPRCFMLKRDTIKSLAFFNGEISNNTFELDRLMRRKKVDHEIIRATGALVYIKKQDPPSSLKKNRRDDDASDKNDPEQMSYTTKGRKKNWADSHSSNTSIIEYGSNIEQLIGIPLTSIIILTFNQLKFTKECLNSILEYTKIPYELILVDNGSTDGTTKYLNKFAKNHNNVQLILNNRNLGFASGNNQGLKRAKGKYILLLNNDVIVTKHWLGHLISHLDTHPNIGLVGPMSNSVSGPQLVGTVNYGKNTKAMQRFAMDFAAKNNGKSSEILRLVGFCLLIKRQVLDIIGGLDENYGNGNYEDDDLCLRARIAGFRSIIAHDVFIHHYGSMTFKGNRIDYRDSLKGNRLRFTKKWKDIIEVNGNEYRLCMKKEDQVKKLLEWGEERFSQRHFKAAVKIFERVLKLDKANSQAMNNLGVIQWQISREPASAMKIFQAALTLNPKDSDALENLVQAATESSRFDLINPALLNTVKKAQSANPDLVTLINAQQNLAMTA